MSSNPQESLTELKAQLSANPQDLPLLKKIGTLLYEKHVLNEAQEYWEQANQLAPQDQQVLNYLGAVYLDLGKNKKGKTESQAVSKKSLCNSSSAKQAGIKNNPDPGYWRYAVDLFV